jgi:hypothetical protein
MWKLLTVSMLFSGLVSVGTLPAHAQPPTAATAEEPSFLAVSPNDRAECSWLGQRLVRVLLRDDLIAAEGFHTFFNTFDCPTEHLARAFGCTIPAAGVEDMRDLEKHAATCWKNPSATLQLTPPEKKEGEKN